MRPGPRSLGLGGEPGAEARRGRTSPKMVGSIAQRTGRVHPPRRPAHPAHACPVPCGRSGGAPLYSAALAGPGLDSGSVVRKPPRTLGPSRSLVASSPRSRPSAPLSSFPRAPSSRGLPAGSSPIASWPHRRPPPVRAPLASGPRPPGLLAFGASSSGIGPSPVPDPPGLPRSRHPAPPGARPPSLAGGTLPAQLGTPPSALGAGSPPGSIVPPSSSQLVLLGTLRGSRTEPTSCSLTSVAPIHRSSRGRGNQHPLRRTRG